MPVQESAVFLLVFRFELLWFSNSLMTTLVEGLHPKKDFREPVFLEAQQDNPFKIGKIFYCTIVDLPNFYGIGSNRNSFR